MKYLGLSCNKLLNHHNFHNMDCVKSVMWFVKWYNSHFQISIQLTMHFTVSGKCILVFLAWWCYQAYLIRNCKVMVVVLATCTISPAVIIALWDIICATTNELAIVFMAIWWRHHSNYSDDRTKRILSPSIFGRSINCNLWIYWNNKCKIIWHC